MNELSKALINARNLEGAIKSTDETILLSEKLLKEKSLQSQWTNIKRAHSYTCILKAGIVGVKKLAYDIWLHELKAVVKPVR